MREDNPESMGKPKSIAAGRKAAVARLGVDEAVSLRPKRDLTELYRFWAGTDTAEIPRGESIVRRQVVEWMSEPETLESRVAELGKRLGGVFEELIGVPDYRSTLEALSTARRLAHLNEYDLRSCLEALERRALVIPVDHETGAAASGSGKNGSYAIPTDLADALVRARRVRMRGIFDLVTLRGHLDKAYSDPARAALVTPQRLREMYKMYATDSAAVARVERLPGGVRELVEKAILEFGGVLSKALFERMKIDLPHWNGRRWAMILEQSLVGTVQPVDLSRYGIAHCDDTLVVFNEVALAWLRRVAVPSDPDRPHEELARGIDVFTNVSRFLAFLQENDVRYTVKGEIFKTTEKKILQHLIPNPGRELSREEVLQFIFGFARSEGLVDGTGERTLGVTSEGRMWGSKPLQEKLERLLDFALGEAIEGMDPFHQGQLRQLLLRMLKRIEPGTWYDLMYLPFLARNQYLASLDDLDVAEAIADRNQRGRNGPLEDIQRMSWNLVRWARQRLYLLGVVDLGYDAAGRPVALRLTHSGARLLGLDAGTSARPGVGNLVVTPDFEVVLFKSSDDAELMHDLDRFCVRDKVGETIHFRIVEQAVRRALIEGMRLDRILTTLESNSRTPVPQNVTYSIRDWALQAGLMVIDADLKLRAEDTEALRRLAASPGARSYVVRVLEPTCIQLGGKTTPRRMRALLRDLGYIVELHPDLVD
ncbi:helicase-associated domain-containing protein [Engelhardtia mirabilis]|uniref:Helicase XPB/Ssl2 N-terminal domain-containing protein n=1 Tax=Engelhardtia mirabilis TaxID=2528011 RepID=A0A518BKS7_9BACT|nr:hypothetical protein Pla133_26600 [Planctomycetes bacterium Pla133]QDV01898.1 hypothetical protein Pla86_26590 [Planctomycetes bacterium Pla86]